MILNLPFYKFTKGAESQSWVSLIVGNWGNCSPIFQELVLFSLACVLLSQLSRADTKGQQRPGICAGFPATNFIENKVKRVPKQFPSCSSYCVLIAYVYWAIWNLSDSPAHRAFLSFAQLWRIKFSMCGVLLGYSLEPRLNSSLLATVGSVMTSSLDQ